MLLGLYPLQGAYCGATAARHLVHYQSMRTSPDQFDIINFNLAVHLQHNNSTKKYEKFEDLS